MNWKFKLSKRLAMAHAAGLIAAAAVSACAADQSVTSPAASSQPSKPTTDSTPVTPSQPGQPVIPPPSGSVTHAGYFVSPSGSSAADGSASNPWSLGTALSGGNGKIQPGDTVWLRSGTYTGAFSESVSGAAGKAVVFRQFPGERATIDGVGVPGGGASILRVGGSYTEYWDFEITNSDPNRSSSGTTHDARPNVVANYANHTKYENLVVHDGGVAFYNEHSYGDVEIAGCLIYNNGWQGPDRGHGHALYLKSDGGLVTARDNILFDQFGFGVHLYSDAGTGANSNVHIIGNVAFNNGTLANNSTSGNILMGGENPSTGDEFTDNMTYYSAGIAGQNVTMGFGSTANGSASMTNNYFAGGSGVLQVGFWSSLAMSGNTLIGTVSPLAVANDPAISLTSGLTLLATLPGATKVFVRPSISTPGRGNIIVYNWGGQGAVSVDLSGIVPAGVPYTIHNAQDIFGAPVASGIGGGSVILSLAAVPAASVVGLGNVGPSTGSQFAVFVVTTS